MKCGIDKVVFGLGRSVIDLNGQDPVAGQSAELGRGRPGPSTMPHVDVQAAVDPVSQADDLKSGVKVGDLRPRQPLQVDEKAVIGGTITQAGEPRRTLFGAPLASENV